MDLFPDGTRVRLKNRARGTYLSADEDGAGVSLSAHRAAPSAAWEVRRERNLWGLHFTCLLLRSAASGRFLSVAPDHRGRRVAQRVYDEEKGDHPGAFLWRPIRPTEEHGRGSDGDEFAILLHVLGLAIRADDGRFDGVATADLDSVRPQMMHWSAEVEAAAPPLRPALLPDHPEAHGEQNPVADADGAGDDDDEDAAAGGGVVLALPAADRAAIEREAARLRLRGRLQELYQLMERQCEAALEHHRIIRNIQDEAKALGDWSRVRQDRRPHDEALIKIERSYDLQARLASNLRLKLVGWSSPPI